MNIIFKYQPTGWVPYNHVLFQDLRGNLVMHCLHVMIGLLDYKKISNQIEEAAIVKVKVDETLFGNTFDSNPEYAWSTKLSLQRNVFAILLAQLHNKSDLNILLFGFIRLMNNPLRAMSTYLPGSMKSVIYYEELLMLLWITLSNNRVRKLLYFFHI